MDSGDSPLSWFRLGNVKDKVDSFCSDVDRIINQVPIQYAENRLLTAGTNVKQFCAELMEEMFPEADRIINTLKERTSELFRTDMNMGPTKELSDIASPCPMEIVENELADSALGVENEVGEELCFEEIRFRETTSLTSNVNDRLEERRIEEIAASRVSKADAEVQSFRSEMSEDKWIMLDSKKSCLVPNFREENLTLQGSLLTSCLTIKSGEESDCEKPATRSMDGEAEFDGLGGNSTRVLPSEHADQSSWEPDWVIV